MTQGLGQVIEWIYGYTGDYGAAIVIITIIIRILLLPLNKIQRAQVKKQQELAAEAQRLKEAYKNNQQKMDEELRRLYQERGIQGAGCLMSFIQLPIMLCLYNAVRAAAAAGAATVLLPWVSSLLIRDETLMLPIATLIVQLLPQTYPYIRYFKSLKQQKTSGTMILTMLVMNSLFVFAIPSGVGLYYFVSGLFTAAEQLIVNISMVRKSLQTA